LGNGILSSFFSYLFSCDYFNQFPILQIENQLKAPKLKSQYIKPKRMKQDYFKVSCPVHSFMGFHMGQNLKPLLQFVGGLHLF
jgi:hypothetical protein